MDDEQIDVNYTLDYFSEHNHVIEIIDDLHRIVDADISIQEKTYEKFSFILSKYIEQPHLLDSHIEIILEKFIKIIRNSENPMKLKYITFRFMYVVVNVRGYKDIVKQLPHEVSDFEPVLQMLEEQNPNDTNTWTTRYILLLWLSIIVMIPLPLCRFDGLESINKEKTLMSRILELIKIYAIVADKCRDAAAFLSSKFIVRKDVKEIYLKSFLDWLMENSQKTDRNVFIKYGTLACAATIIKHSKREDILPYASNLLQWIINSDLKENSGSNIQKFIYKIIQRIGLIFLPPRVASWRYQRGNRSLAANLSAAAGDLKNISNVSDVEIVDADKDINIPDEVEEVIDQLIQGLTCSDSIVRWSAAKGIGRVTSRLPKELADDVVGSVLELLNPRESDAAWHGGCIALAELGRRGFLLPERLPQVVPLVLKALVYDEPKGYASVGSHIRDAACYVCWAFARAYEPKDLAPYIQDIASTLLVVTCFDKEINCRRAASAAFQEHVGRQGAFPHGINILTVADFYAVSTRNNAYLNISVYIAQYEEYVIPLIDHLIKRKVDHWDCSIRDLAGTALGNLTALAPKHMISNVLPYLFEKTKSIDLNSRHGAVLAIGRIIHGLSKAGIQEHLKLPDSVLQAVKSLVSICQERYYFRGLGGEFMRQACADFIEKCSLAKLPIHDDPVIDSSWLALLNNCLTCEVANVRLAAIAALPAFFNEYLCTSHYTQLVSITLTKYIADLTAETNQTLRMGHASALSALPTCLLQPHFQIVLNALIDASQITSSTLKWAEARKDVIKALVSIVCNMYNNGCDGIEEHHLTRIYDVLLIGLGDYTQDKRGDIGAWVREACVTGLQILTFLLTKYNESFLTELLINKILSNIAQQAVEKIDRTRALSGKIFYSFFYNNPRIPNIQYYDEICSIFPKDECDDLNWNSAAATFPKFVQLLQFQSYTDKVLCGVICSIGGLTESLVKSSSTALFDYMKQQEKMNGSNEALIICDMTYKIFASNQKVDRITVPLLRFLDKLFDSGCIRKVLENPESNFAKGILKLVIIEITRCKDVYKLIDGVTVLTQLIQVPGDVCQTALRHLANLLCHVQSYVRRSTAVKMYESLLVYGESSSIPPDNLDNVMELLCDTNWENLPEENLSIRKQLRSLMNC